MKINLQGYDPVLIDNFCRCSRDILKIEAARSSKTLVKLPINKTSNCRRL